MTAALKSGRVDPDRPIKVVIAALGGQGGGVITDWLLEAARVEGYLGQATSVPGVAQRTGATIYYLELFPRSAAVAHGREPVLALMPHPGDVDVVVASELVEAGRAVLRGIVTPDKTTLITSSTRVYAMSEKIHMADGRVDVDRIAKSAREKAKKLVIFDMQEVATAHRSVISAAMFGALAGSGALPFSMDAFRKAIEHGGIAVKQSLAAFEAAALKAAQTDYKGELTINEGAVKFRAERLNRSLQTRLDEVPADLRPVVAEGVRRLVDYQDAAYAEEFLNRLEPFLRRGGDPRLAEAVARGLALWMSFEDTIRVADLKIRASRVQRVRKEVQAGAEQLVAVTEFMKPRVHEICGTMPAGLGRWVLGSPRMSGLIQRFTGSRQISTSRLSGFLLLYVLAGMRGWRRRTLRFLEEDARIRSWLSMLDRLSASDYELAVEVAECQRLVKGYGDTHERGTRNFDLLMARVESLVGKPASAVELRKLRLAASADEDGVALTCALA